MRFYSIILIVVFLSLSFSRAGALEHCVDFETCSQSAALGDKGAQTIVGLMYLSGKGVEQSDREAGKLLRKAAKQGHATAQYYLAVLYRQGRGIVKSDFKSYAWARLAASNGKVKAQELIIEIEEGWDKETLLEAREIHKNYKEKYH